MKRLITFIAVLIISAGFTPAASSLFAQGEYGQYSDPQAGPPPPPAPGPDQNAPGPSQDQAQNQPQGDQSQSQSDANAPGVARASLIQGDVSSQQDDNSQLVPVTLNTPLEAGERVSTAKDARAEIELDYGDQLRLSSDTTAKIASLSRQNIQVQIGQGLATYSVLPGSQAQVEIDTPNAALHPDAEGDYRILVNSDAETKIIVRSGSADVSTPQGSTHVDAGQMITIAGTDNPQYRIDTAPGRDDWDAWNADRDHRVETAKSFSDTNQYYTGTEDLDPYGEWSEVPDYGNVWFPNNGADWAPYRDGSWVYEPYYGWTWVSYEPWGWAPYHYGRWFVYGGRWGWWPGPVYAGYYPVWAPAYVSFFGWGGGFGFGFGFGFGGWGHVGWLPIGPGDWYHPWYGRWGTGFHAVGFADYDRFHEGFGPLHGGYGRQFSNIHDAMMDGRVRSGISSMSGSEFGRGRVPMNQARIDDATFRQASAMTGRMPVTPSRESYSPTGHFANASNFRNMPSSSQHFFSPNRGNGGFAANNSRSQGAFADRSNGVRGNSQASSQNGRSGWRTFTPPSSANRGNSQSSAGNRGGNQQSFAGDRGAAENRDPAMNRGAAQNRAGNNGGWQHFTPPTQAQNERNFSRPSNNEPSRSYQSPQAYRGGSNSYRPPLNMREPIATPRGGSNYGNSNRGYSAPRGGYYSAPAQRGGGNFSAPRGGGYSAPRGGGYSAPRSGGGGGSHGGGGGGHSGGRR